MKSCGKIPARFNNQIESYVCQRKIVYYKN